MFSLFNGIVSFRIGCGDSKVPNANLHPEEVVNLLFQFEKRKTEVIETTLLVLQMRFVRVFLTLREPLIFQPRIDSQPRRDSSN